MLAPRFMVSCLLLFTSNELTMARYCVAAEMWTRGSSTLINYLFATMKKNIYIYSSLSSLSFRRTIKVSWKCEHIYKTTPKYFLIWSDDGEEAAKTTINKKSSFFSSQVKACRRAINVFAYSLNTTGRKRNF